MQTERKLDLLLAEYLQLQKSVEEFDARALTIKAWSVTLSAAGIVTAYVQTVPFVLVVSALSALVFWLVEASWKVNQQAFYKRIREIEGAMRTGNPEIAPLQIASSWSASWHAGRKNRKILWVMSWMHVWLPHVPVAVGGILLYWLLPPWNVGGS